MNTKVKYLLALLMVLVIAAGGYFYWQARQRKSPEYSLGLLQTAATTHNWQAFEEHIDLNSLYSKAFEDVIAPTLNQPGNTAINDFLAGILGTIKTSFVSSMTEHTKDYITNGQFSEDKLASPEQLFPRRFVNMLDINNLKFKSIGSSKVTADTATIDVIASDTVLGKDFTIQFNLVKLPDETWKVTSINKLVELIATIKKAQTEKLAELNKPLEEKIQKEIAITKSNFEIKTRKSPWISNALIYKPTLSFKSAEQITGFIGQVQVLNKNKEPIYSQKYIVPGPFPIGTTQDYSFSWTLNPFVSGDKFIIDSDPNDLTLKETIIRVRFNNGNELQLLEVLPGKPLEDEQKAA